MNILMMMLLIPQQPLICIHSMVDTDPQFLILVNRLLNP